MATKVDIISGFLGAGKTTLIKKLIQEVFAGQQIVLIENEFGEIGIDGGFLSEAGINITEMNSGCICCSLVGDFGTALKEVVEKYSPERIIIEPSGVGKLSDVEKAVMAVEGLEITTTTAVVDAKKAKMYMKNFGEFFNDQVETARTIILSRTQDLSDEKLSVVVDMLKEKNKDAVVITTAWDSISGEQILSAMERSESLEKELLLAQEHEHHHHHHEHGEECTCGCHDHDHEEHEHHHHDGECCHHDHEEHEHHHHDGECCHHDHEEHEHHHEHEEHDHHHDHGEECTCGCHDHDHHHHHADEVFTSWGVETPKKFNEDKLDEILDTLSSEDTECGIILRAKGIVPSESGEWLHFDLTPGEYEIRKGAADYTGRLCVIGSNINEDKLTEMFEV